MGVRGRRPPGCLGARGVACVSGEGGRRGRHWCDIGVAHILSGDNPHHNLPGLMGSNLVGSTVGGMTIVNHFMCRLV